MPDRREHTPRNPWFHDAMLSQLFEASTALGSLLDEHRDELPEYEAAELDSARNILAELEGVYLHAMAEAR